MTDETEPTMFSLEADLAVARRAIREYEDKFYVEAARHNDTARQLQEMTERYRCAVNARDNLIQQVQQQAQEARTQKHIVSEIGELVGSRRDWEMVSAVRNRLQEISRERDAWRQSAETQHAMLVAARYGRDPGDVECSGGLTDNDDLLIPSFATVVEKKRISSGYTAEPDPEPAPGPQLFFLQSDGCYVGNCPLWWAKDSRGYTTHIEDAELFTAAEIDQLLAGLSGRDDRPWPEHQVRQAASLQVDMQRLRSK